VSVKAPICSRGGGNRDRGLCARRSALGTKFTVLLLLVALFLVAFVAGLVHRLG
jgi:hypothetical protein